MDGVINFLKKKRDDIARSVMDDKGLVQRGRFAMPQRVLSPVPEPQKPIQFRTPSYQMNEVKRAVLKPFAGVQRSIESGNRFQLPTLQAPQLKNPVSNAAVQAGTMVANLPMYLANDIVGRGIIDPALDIGKMAGKTISGQPLPSYSQLKSAPARLAYNIMGNNRNVKQVIGNVAGTALPMVDAYGGGKVFGMGRQIVNNLGRQGFVQAVKQGAITGGREGLKIGALEGLSEGRNDKSVLNQVGRAIMSSAQYGGAGAVFGSLLGGGGYAGGRVLNSLAKAYKANNPQATDDVALQVSKQFIRDEAGRFTKGSKEKVKTFIKDAKITDADRKALRRSLGLPEDGNYEGGFIKPDEIVGGKPQVDPLIQEARKYKSAEEFFLRMSDKNRDAFRNSGIRGREAIEEYWNKNAKKLVSEPILDTLNPTGSLYVDYDPKSRMTMKLGKNITTYDKTANLDPDEIITIYRGASKKHKKINPGDFVTTKREVAEGYTGDNNVLELKVKARDILDDIAEPLGDEYIYRPQSQLTDIWNKAQQPTLKVQQSIKTNPNHVPPERIGIRQEEYKSGLWKGLYKDIAYDKKTGKDLTQLFTGADIQDIKKYGYQPPAFDTNGFPLPRNQFQGEAPQPTLKAQQGNIKSNEQMLPPQNVTQPKNFTPINPDQMIAKQKLPGIMYTTSKTKAEGRKMKITEPTAESKPLPWETKIHKETGIALPPKSNKPPQGDAPRDTDVLPQFKQIIQDWRNRVLAGKQEADLTSTTFSKLPDQDGYKIVKYLENPTPEKAKQLGLDINKYQGEVNAIRGYYNSIRQEGLQRGLDIKYLNNYINHVWKETPKEIFDLIDKNVKAIGKTPSFVKERRIPTYEEGLAVGLTPKFTHPAQLASHYRMQLERATAAKNLVDELSKSGIVQSVDRAPLGWKVIDAPLIPDLNGKFAPQKVAEQLSNVFGQAPDNAFTKTVDFTANVSKVMQDVTLSGGIRTLNAFSLGNLVKEFTAGRIVGPLKAFARSFTDGSSASYFKENGQVLTELAERGVPIRTNLDYTQAYKNMAESPTIQKTIGKLWSDNINKPTFARFLPMLQVEFYKDARKAGMNADQAAKATKNFYGVVDNFTRSKQAENVLSTIFFAPRFRESMINFWLNNARSLKNPTAPEFRANQAFIVGTITSYILYSYLNKQLTGRYMHENKEGKEFSIEIPRGEGRSWYIPMLPSIGTIPRRAVEMGNSLLQGDVAGATQKAGSFFSQPVSLGSQLLTNRTFYGGPIYNEEDSAPAKIGKLAGYGVGQSLHPFLGEPIEVMQGRKTPTEAGLGMLEMPVYPSRSTDTAGLTGTQYNKYRELAKNNKGEAERYLRVSLGNKEQNKLDSKENAKRKAIKEGTATLKEAPQTSWIDKAFSVFASSKEQAPTKSANTQRIDDLMYAYKLEKYAGAPPSDPLKKITFDREKLSKAKSIFKSDDVNDQERQGMIERLGYNIDDVKYDVASNLTTAEKASYMVERMKSMDAKRALQFLEETRTKSLSGDTMGTKAVYDLLIDNGYMDKGTRDYLLSFELEKDSKTRKSTKKSTGKGRKIKIGTTPKSSTVKVSFSSSPVSTNGIKMQAPKINVNIPSRNRRTGAKGKPNIGMMQVKGVKKIKFA